MKIVADENIPFITEACEDLGETTTLTNRAIDNSAVKETDCLFVRSLTKVNADLLAGSPVRFIGSATIGVDHVDQEYLAREGIGFSSAPGSNANSVGEYIVAALLELALRKSFTLRGRTLGIIGVGNVGSRVAAKAKALGLKLLLNDPPRERAQAEPGQKKYKPIKEAVTAEDFYTSALDFVSLDALLPKADLVTLHVPLERAGQDPTFHLADREFFKQLKPGAIFLNTSRGSVHDETQLHQAIDSGKLCATVLDVWEHELDLDIDLLQKADLASPHIAGYSFDGKVCGTRMIVNAARQFFNQLAGEGYSFNEWDPAPLMPEPEAPRVTLDGATGDLQTLLNQAVQACYNIMTDDDTMRQSLELPREERILYYDELRNQYRYRREFFNTEVSLFNPPEGLAATLAGIGFKVM
ncbi:MAG: 4-phosphoerythronate dehydrogenase [Planctomycetes bacterium]|nr:4-phosphoerythronate dehydrogenase [Planctomycetota bacterium]